jgi:hypothetical protein
VITFGTLFNNIKIERKNATGGLEQTFVVSIILAEQKKGTLAHTLVPYQNLRRNKMPLSPHLT